MENYIKLLLLQSLVADFINVQSQAGWFRLPALHSG